MPHLPLKSPQSLPGVASTKDGDICEGVNSAPPSCPHKLAGVADVTASQGTSDSEPSSFLDTHEKKTQTVISGDWMTHHPCRTSGCRATPGTR